jgi:hypothetical protein
MVQGYPELNNRGVHRIGLEVYDPTIDDSSYRWNFILDKKNKIRYHSWKEHLKMSKIAKFGCELL